MYAEAAGVGRMLPAAVAVPSDADDVVALVRWARLTGAPLTARGSGSSMSGGAIGPGVIVDLSRLDAIGPVDVPGRRVWVGPGAVRDAVDAAARAHGLRFPIDPSSGRFCTVGGMASTNAAGARTLKFGAMRAWVSALDCVFEDGSRVVVRRGDDLTRYLDLAPVRRFADLAMPAIYTAAAEERGDRLRHARVRKESSGYALAEFARSGDLLDLLVGSEGTLALFVGLELSLTPVARATSTLLATWDSIERAVTAASFARAAGASACELLDRTFLDVAARRAMPVAIPEGTETALLVETESDDGVAAAVLARSLAAEFREAGATRVELALDPRAEHDLWTLRHAASPILAALDPNLKSMQFVEDGAVPPEHLAEYVRGVRAALAERGLAGVIFGHAGDAHVHVNPLIDVRLPDWRARAESLLDEVSALTAWLGGTLAGEHGDGRLRTPLLDRVWRPDATSLFALVKRAFDPAGILNPGVKVALPDQRALEDVKYDPALAPLPPEARGALDVVERERAYARFRLDLLREAESGARTSAASAPVLD